jgi:protein SCO1/2
MRAWVVLGALAGCWGSNAYIIEGEVVEVNPPSQVVIRHEAVPGLMDSMTMPFSVRDPGLLQGLQPGDAVYARLIAERESWWLAEIREHEGRTRPHLAVEPVDGPGPVRPGQPFPATTLTSLNGETLNLGPGQSGAVLLTFLYTTCPRPEFCPALTARLQALQASLQPGEATIVTVTVDPDGDTPAVLQTWAEQVQVQPATWKVVRTDGQMLKDLALSAALTVDPGTNEIIHSIRVLVLDSQGRLVERYDDARFPQDRVLQQLRTGSPPAPSGADGTVTPP